MRPRTKRPIAKSVRLLEPLCASVRKMPHCNGYISQSIRNCAYVCVCVCVRDARIIQIVFNLQGSTIKNRVFHVVAPCQNISGKWVEWRWVTCNNRELCPCCFRSLYSCVRAPYRGGLDERVHCGVSGGEGNSPRF